MAIEDFLKYEKTPRTREWIDAKGEEKEGFYWRDYKNADGSLRRVLVLTNPDENGKVLIQPFNCVISLKSHKNLKEIFNKYAATGGQPPEGFKEQMIKSAALYGITYIDFPNS